MLKVFLNDALAAVRARRKIINQRYAAKLNAYSNNLLKYPRVAQRVTWWCQESSPGRARLQFHVGLLVHPLWLSLGWRLLHGKRGKPIRQLCLGGIVPRGVRRIIYAGLFRHLYRQLI